MLAHPYAPQMAPSPNLSAFEGRWLLRPDQCHYEFGLPPQQGIYIIQLHSDGRVSLTSRWTTPSGRLHVLRFTGRLDGKPHPLIGSRIADAIQLDYVSPTQLNSSAWHDGQKVMWAERMLTLPDVLRIDVHGSLANGAIYTNTDVYRRASSEP